MSRIKHLQKEPTRSQSTPPGGKRRPRTPSRVLYDRQKAGYHKLRNWRIEGSNDANKFTCLRQHNNDSTPGNTAMSEANWNVDEGDNFYRYFRIFQNGKNSSNTNHLMCTGIELYGELREE